MLNFSYTISPFLKKELQTLSDLRNSILLELISPKDETKMQWEALMDRIYYSFHLTGQKIPKKEIGHIVSMQGKPFPKSPEKDIVLYKRSYDYLKQHWIQEPDARITNHELLLFFGGSTHNIAEHNKDMTTMLSFLQVNPEPPVIQAALAFVMLNHILGNNDESKRMATLLSYVFLYKDGFYFRDLMVLEEHFAVHKAALEGALTGAYQRKNLSPFLDFYIFAVEDQVKKALHKLKNKNIETVYPDSFFELTERQKEIISSLDKPGARITNKVVQKQFKISQITASRELAKLASLGLILSLGKGRSVYYTKA